MGKKEEAAKKDAKIEANKAKEAAGKAKADDIKAKADDIKAKDDATKAKEAKATADKATKEAEKASEQAKAQEKKKEADAAKVEEMKKQLKLYDVLFQGTYITPLGFRVPITILLLSAADFHFELFPFLLSSYAYVNTKYALSQ